MSENPPHVEAGRLAGMMRPQGLQIGCMDCSNGGFAFMLIYLSG